MNTATSEVDSASCTAAIAALNDAARSQILGNSRVVFTRSLLDTVVDQDVTPAERRCRRLAQQALIMQKVAAAPIDPGKDPHGERDFGAIDHDGHKLFWKIDVYENDGTFQWGAEQPWDEAHSYRVLTIMLASDY